MQEKYQNLHALSRNAAVLSGIQSLICWDEETYMPPAAAVIRAEQIKTLAGLVHRELTSKEFTRALSQLVDLKTGKIIGKGLNESQKAALQQWHRDWRQQTALPQDFVEDFAKLTAEAMHVWRKSRKEKKFRLFLPFLEKIVAMSRKKADLLGWKEHPYDALLDLYEPEMTTSETNRLFQQLKKELDLILKKILKAKPVDDRFLHQRFLPSKQMKLSHQLLKAIGHDMERGRLDISTHPFSSACHPTDSRITTRINPQELMSCLSSVLHEAGHSFYEMGLPVESYGSPLGQAVSLGVHESQSRWWETRIGQSKPFWIFFLPMLKKAFKKQLEGVTVDAFWRAINKVEPSFIRVEADEATYSLHVILRFELEKQLIEGSLNPREIPEAWNEKMQSLLHIYPEDDSQGCLQDVHWSMGGIGYFPSYTLGNLYAAQYFETFAKEHPKWEKEIAEGKFSPMKNWLTKQIHQYGRQYSPEELMQRITGRSFSVEPYARYLNQKYTEIYNYK